ncbi:MAG TPA: hypothetical protein VF712_15800 [Thermoleophilaceae bacterium]|jgi:hypothetical protein
MANLERFQMVERDFLPLAAQAGLPEPDEVNYREDEEEVEFVWHEQKLAVIVELDELDERAVGDPLPDIPF